MSTEETGGLVVLTRGIYFVVAGHHELAAVSRRAACGVFGGVAPIISRVFFF